MKDLKGIFGKPSVDFLALNPCLTAPPDQKNNVQPIVATRRGKMNRVEAEFAMILEAMKRKGEILRYEFEGITLRFANVKYTPDFVVFPHVLPLTYEQIKNLPTNPVNIMTTTSRLRFIEVKGQFIKGNRERAVERFRHAKTYWPEFTFELHQRTKDGWSQLI